MRRIVTDERRGPAPKAARRPSVGRPEIPALAGIEYGP